VVPTVPVSAESPPAFGSTVSESAGGGGISLGAFLPQPAVIARAVATTAILKLFLILLSFSNMLA
jgi:hypothetical protein